MVCIQSDIFHQSFSLRVNIFIIQYFGSLLRFAGPLSKSGFLIDFSFSFPVIYLQIYCSIQTFKLVCYSLMPHFRGPRSWVSLENFGVLGPGSHLRGPGTRFPLDHIGVSGPTYGILGPRSHLAVPGPRSWLSGPTFPVCPLRLSLEFLLFSL